MCSKCYKEDKKNNDFIILNLVSVLLSREFAGFEVHIYLQILITFFKEKNIYLQKVLFLLILNNF